MTLEMKIAIVNDVPRYVDALRRAVALKPEFRLAWTASSGEEAVERCAQDRPDVILMDLMMPGIGGAEATRRIMAATPCAILIVTADIGANAALVFETMGHGALDAVDLPPLGVGDLRKNAATLLTKIEGVARLLQERKNHKVSSRLAEPAPRCDRLLAIGASAGGPAALAALLRGLPRDFPAGVVIIQHVDPAFAPGMAAWLGEQSKLSVRVAVEGDRPTVGSVLLAGSADHLALKTSDRLGYTAEPRHLIYRPSVDVFFHSVAKLWRGRLVGVLLTGMGQDGAAGLKSLRDKGCHTIAQDQASSAVYGMPKAAAELNAASEILSLEQIAPRLNELFPSLA